MAPTTYDGWVADGRPWHPAQPVADLSAVLGGYGYTVYVLGNDTHLRAKPPEDHDPYSATGWPVTSPYPYVHACDIMPPTKAGLPTLAQLGAQLYADKQAGAAAWLKYMNWEPNGPDGACYHDEWQPNHTRTSSTDRGHIHGSIRSDYTHSTAAAGYDPVARLRGDDLSAKSENEIEQVYSAIFYGGPSMGAAAGTKVNAQSKGNAVVDLLQSLRTDTAAIKAQLAALAGKDMVDEAAIAKQVVTLLSPEAIAEAVVAGLPKDLAVQVVTELNRRLSAAA
jgi:hypothetical protein